MLVVDFDGFPSVSQFLVSAHLFDLWQFDLGLEGTLLVRVFAAAAVLLRRRWRRVEEGCGLTRTGMTTRGRRRFSTVRIFFFDGNHGRRLHAGIQDLVEIRLALYLRFYSRRSRYFCMFVVTTHRGGKFTATTFIEQIAIIQEVEPDVVRNIEIKVRRPGRSVQFVSGQRRQIRAENVADRIV